MKQILWSKQEIAESLSQNIEQDGLKVQLEQKVFEHDPDIEIEEEKIKEFKYSGKAPQ